MINVNFALTRNSCARSRNTLDKREMMNFFAEVFILVLLPSVRVALENECKPGSSQSFRLSNSGVLALKGGIISELAVHSTVECGLHCLAKKFCVGHNFNTNAKRNEINCQLTISKDHNFEKSAEEWDWNSAEEWDWNFYETVGKREEDPCEDNPCKNGGKAVPDANPLSYKCECSSEYEGEHCTVWKAVFKQSVILSGKNNSDQQLTQWIGGNWTAKLCWRATRDGWTHTEFHSGCDDKAPTVAIVKVGDYVFGGFATATWSGGSGYKKAPGSFMFSLRKKENLSPFIASLKVEDSSTAIVAHHNYGPTFGGGHDLYISNNAASNNNSYTNFNVDYNAPPGVSDVKTILAGTEYFTPSEVEVFYLV